MNALSHAWLDLAGTILVECGIAASLVANRRPRALADVAWANLLTNPLAHALWLWGVGFWPIELGVLASEACLFRVLIAASWARAVGLSLLLNGATIAISLWVS